MAYPEKSSFTFLCGEKFFVKNSVISSRLLYFNASSALAILWNLIFLINVLRHLSIKYFFRIQAVLSIVSIEISGSITGDRTIVLFKKSIESEVDILNEILPPSEKPIKCISLS